MDGHEVRWTEGQRSHGHCHCYHVWPSPTSPTGGAHVAPHLKQFYMSSGQLRRSHFLLRVSSYRRLNLQLNPSRDPTEPQSVVWRLMFTLQESWFSGPQMLRCDRKVRKQFATLSPEVWPSSTVDQLGKETAYFTSSPSALPGCPFVVIVVAAVVDNIYWAHISVYNLHGNCHVCIDRDP